MDKKISVGRRHRWLLWGLGVVFTVMVVVLAFVYLVLTHLDSPAVKSVILDRLQKSTGIHADFRSLHLDLLHGITIDGLSVQNPPQLQGYAHDLADVKRIAVKWNLASLDSNRRRIWLTIDQPSIYVVQDAKGRTAFDILFPSTKPKQKVPLSQALKLGNLGLDLRRLRISDLHFEFLKVKVSGGVQKVTVDGLQVQGNLLAAGGTQQALLEIGSNKGRPIGIGLDGQTAHIYLNFKGKLGGQNLALSVDSGLKDQGMKTLPDRVQKLLRQRHLARAQVNLEFDEKHQKVRIVLKRLALLGGVMGAGAEIELPDRPVKGVIAFVHNLDIRAHSTRSVDTLLASILKGRGQVAGIDVRFHVPALAVSGRPPFFMLRQPAHARILVKRAAVQQAGFSSTITGLDFRISASEDRDSHVKTKVVLGVSRVAVSQKSGLSAVVDKLDAGLDLPPIGMDALVYGRHVRGNIRSAGLHLRMAPRIKGQKPLTVRAQSMALGMLLPAQPKGRMQGSADLTLKGLAVNAPGIGITPTDAGLHLDVSDVVLNKKDPRMSSGTAHVHLGTVPFSLDIRVDKHKDLVRMDGALKSGHLAALQDVLPGGVRRLGLPLGRMSVAIAVHGRAHGVFSSNPVVDAAIGAGLKGLGARLGKDWLRVPTVMLKGKAGMDAGRRIWSRLSLRMQRPALKAGRIADQVNADIKASIRRSRRVHANILLTARKNGRNPMKLGLDVRADSTFRHVQWDAGLDMKALDTMRAFIPRAIATTIGLGDISVHASTKGRASAVKSFSDLKRIALDQETSVTIKGARIRLNQMEATLPTATLSLKTKAGHDQGTARLNLSIPDTGVKLKGRHLDARGVALVLRAHARGLNRSGSLDLDMLAGLAQLHGYVDKFFPIKNLSIGLQTTLGRDAKLDKMVIQNQGTRTSLVLHGVVAGLLASRMRVADLAMRKTLYVTGELKQVMAGLPLALGRGSGRITVPFRVESPDQGLFRISMTMDARDVNFRARDLQIRGLRGKVPVVEEFAVGKNGIHFIAGKKANLYTLVRYLDMHAFLAKQAYMAVDRLRVGPLRVGPLAGNLRVLRNVFSLDQLQAGWRQGHIAGQVVFQYDARDTRVYFRGRVTGVRPTKGKARLDANAALYLSLGNQELSGRIHLIRIGRQHLLDALDLVDPFHENIGVNRIRKLLGIAYPKYVRVRLDQGFLSAKVALGGLGRIVSIQELRGIPTGPILRKVLSLLPLHGGQ